MQRVLVLGSSGSCKSTFARTLGAITSLPVVHIDQLFWEPGWVQAPTAVYLDRLRQALARERWIIDGNNPSTLDLRVPRADRIVLLDRSRLVCLMRIGRRVATSYGKVRANMAPGLPREDRPGIPEVRLELPEQALAGNACSNRPARCLGSNHNLE